MLFRSSGLTIALLQARQGKRVTLIERQPKIGGYLNRFMRDGLHFDTGFHFTGGNGGIFQQILEMLDFDSGDFKLSPLPTDVWLEETQRRFDFPNRGLQAQCQAVCDAFPEKAASIRQYYEAELNSIIDSPLHDLSLLKRMDALSGMTEFDAITVNDLFLKLGIDEPQLRALLPIDYCDLHLILFPIQTNPKDSFERTFQAVCRLFQQYMHVWEQIFFQRCSIPNCSLYDHF